MEPETSMPDAYVQYLNREVAKWARVIKSIGISLQQALAVSGVATLPRNGTHCPCCDAVTVAAPQVGINRHQISAELTRL